MSTVFVTLTDQSYFEKARKTLWELRVNGEWTGDVVLIAVDFHPDPIEGVRILETSHIPTESLVRTLREHPIRPMADNRHFGKLYQWDKLQVFKPFVRQWERVVFLDAGLRVFHSVHPLLALEWRGKFLAPDDSDPYDNGARFRLQLDLNANPEVTSALLSEYSEDMLEQRYFLNCIFMFDTALLDQVSFEELEDTMNRYPISMCNEMGILNLIFTFKLQAWVPFPQKVGERYLFGWSENNYRERPTWTSFHFMKYSLSG